MKTKQRPQGVTLIELLTVVTVIIVVAAVAIPAVRILTRDLKIREAARDLQVFLADVQAEARATGNAGIWIERDPESPNSSVIVYRVKNPPAYSGDFYNAKAVLEVNAGGAFIYFPQATCSLMDPATPLRSYGQAGNRVRLEFRGVELFLSAFGGVVNDPVFNNPSYQFQVDRRSWATGDLPVGTFPYQSFEVYPQPIKRSTRFLQLPENTFIDLSKSGFSVLDLDGDGLADLPGMGSELRVDPTDTTPGDVIVMFGGDGAVDWVASKNLVSPTPPPSQTLYLFLCMDNRTTTEELNPALPAGPTYPDPLPYYSTLNEAQNLWIAFGRNGRLSLGENSEPTERGSDNEPDVLRASRSIARQQIQMQAD